MATNVQKLASQIRDIYTGGNPDSQSRITLGQIELLVTQMAPALRVQNFREMYDQFGAHEVDGKFWKYYTINLSAGGTFWKKCVLPEAYLTLPTNRGFSVFEADSLCVIEVWPKEELAAIAGGLAQSTGQYFACPAGTYLEIRSSCNRKLPKISQVEVGMIVPDASCVDEAIDLILIERVLNILRGQPFPDKNVNANPQ
jgi:hypothetical protein